MAVSDQWSAVDKPAGRAHCTGNELSCGLDFTSLVEPDPTCQRPDLEAGILCAAEAATSEQDAPVPTERGMALPVIHRVSRVAVTAAILFAALPAPAQTPAGQATSPPTTSPTATATQVDDPPLLDGKILHDPVWASAPAISGFWQTRPSEGQAATERTEVSIIHTRDSSERKERPYRRRPAAISE